MVRLAQQNKEAKLHERLRPWLNTGRQLYSAGTLRVTLKRSAVNRLAVMVATFWPSGTLPSTAALVCSARSAHPPRGAEHVHGSVAGASVARHGGGTLRWLAPSLELLPCPVLPVIPGGLTGLWGEGGNTNNDPNNNNKKKQQQQQ